MLNLSLSAPVRAENAGLFISPGHGIHPDRTIRSYELIFVKRGTLALEEDRRRFDLQPGQTLILWPDRHHRGVEPYARDLSFYWIHFSLAPARRASGKKIAIPQSSALERPDRMAELFHRFLGEQEEGHVSPQEGNLLLSLMLLEVGRSRERPFGPSTSGILARADNYISENFHRNIGAGDVARSLRLNPDYLGRIYRHARGQTLTQAIHRRQIREALALLRDTALNVDEIASASGFQDPRYFRRIFSRYQGVSPVRYRNFHTRIHINTR